MKGTKQGISKLKGNLDKWFSLFIRLRDSDDDGFGHCITCEKRVFWKEADAGHFISRTYLNTRFMPENVNLQCKGCNGFRAGEQYKHGIAINRLHGEGTADKLWLKAQRTGTKWDRIRYQIQIEHYKSCVQDFREQKGMG